MCSTGTLTHPHPCRYRPHADCSLNTTLVTVTLLLVVVLTAVAVHPAVKGGSVMPCSVIGAYITYLALSALASEPAGYQCNGPANQAGLSEGAVTIGMVSFLGLTRRARWVTRRKSRRWLTVMR